MTTVRLRVGATSVVGKVRPNNQDVYLARDHLVAVADGMGGHKGGRTAAETAIEVLERNFVEPTTESLVRATEQANAEIFAKGTSDPELEGMGTTLCALARVRSDGAERLAVANVGDSRVYLFTAGRLHQITVDHTVAEELVAAGELSRKEAAHHHSSHVLTRSLGAFPKVLVDTWELLPVKGDRYLLCSDGLYGEITDAMIAALLGNIRDPEQAAQELAMAAETAGGRDNITVVVVDVAEAEQAEVEGGLAARLLAHVAGHSRVMRDATGEIDLHKSSGDGKKPEAPSRHRWRIGMFLSVLLAIAVAVVAAVSLGASSGFYVGFDESGHVAIFTGRPGGLLWIRPSLHRSTELTRDLVPQSAVADLERGVVVDSSAEAERFVENLRRRSAEIRAVPDESLPPPSGSEERGPTTTSPAADDTTRTTPTTLGQPTAADSPPAVPARADPIPA
ncbi:MAG: serine/threonine protein phosphatase [Acidimicrobiales bacterium]|nr:MAG: serine/threonine protein phosphatase [Acidimicrobiales bacterium]